MTINWFGGDPSTQVGIIAGFSNNQDTNVSGGFVCLAPMGPQTFSVPPGMMANLPASAGGNVQSSLLFLTVPAASQFVKFSTTSGAALDSGMASYVIGDLRNNVTFK